MDIIAALYAALSADATLTGLLDEFDGGPAIFSGDKLPPGCDPSALFFAWIGPAPAMQRDWDTFDAGAREAEIDVRIFQPAQYSSADLDAAAEAARAALHRKTLAGAGEPFATVSGPVSAPTSGPEVAGRRLSVRLNWRE